MEVYNASFCLLVAFSIGYLYVRSNKKGLTLLKLGVLLNL